MFMKGLVAILKPEALCNFVHFFSIFAKVVRPKDVATHKSARLAAVLTTGGKLIKAVVLLMSSLLRISGRALFVSAF